jgi:hypothetical protein
LALVFDAKIKAYLFGDDVKLSSGLAVIIYPWDDLLLVTVFS